MKTEDFIDKNDRSLQFSSVVELKTIHSIKEIYLYLKQYKKGKEEFIKSIVRLRYMERIKIRFCVVK